MVFWDLGLLETSCQTPYFRKFFFCFFFFVFYFKFFIKKKQKQELHISSRIDHNIKPTGFIIRDENNRQQWILSRSIQSGDKSEKYTSNNILHRNSIDDISSDSVINKKKVQMVWDDPIFIHFGCSGDNHLLQTKFRRKRGIDIGISSIWFSFFFFPQLWFSSHLFDCSFLCFCIDWLFGRHLHLYQVFYSQQV